jgi:hypothetical protein
MDEDEKVYLSISWHSIEQSKADEIVKAVRQVVGVLEPYSVYYDKAIEDDEDAGQ